MSNLFSLIKIEFTKSLSSLFSSMKSSKRKSNGALIALIIIGVLILALSFGYSYLMIWIFQGSNIPPITSTYIFAGIT